MSEGCLHCYAERQAGRNPAVLGVWGAQGTREVAAEAQWRLPPKWDREAGRAGVRARVFCASISDVFEGPETMPAGAVGAVAAARRRLFALIDATPNLDWQLLTKRPENVRRFWPDAVRRANVWLGASAETQRRFDERHRPLVDAGDLAAVRFLSVEPQLEFVDARPALGPGGVDWVICGGESGGGGVRAFDPMWARTLRDQCHDAGVAFFFKQLGARPTDRLRVKGKGGDLDDIPEDLRVREFPRGAGGRT